MTPKIIAICGNAFAGKDTLFKILFKILKNKNIQRFALADELKADLNDFLKQKIGISAFTVNPEEKTVIRDMLVAYGKAKRLQSKGQYWTGLLTPKMEACILDGGLPVVTDVRYDVYPQDELYWAKNIMKGCIIHVSRVGVDGKPIPPANIDEAQNEPKLMSQADYCIKWPTCENIDLLVDIVKKQLSPLIEQLC